MFYLIEPQEHHYYPSSINPFLKNLQDAEIIEQPYEISLATFLLLKEELEGVSGGVLLLKQQINMFPTEIREYRHTHYPYIQEIWTGRIAFQICEPLSGRYFEKNCKALYRALYEDLIIFSIKENAPLVCLTMPLIEHLSIEVWGLWPYVLEIRSTDPDGRFHKVLQLPGTFQKPARKCKYGKSIKEFGALSPLFPQNCSKNTTNQEKIRPFFPS